MLHWPDSFIGLSSIYWRTSACPRGLLKDVSMKYLSNLLYIYRIFSSHFPTKSCKLSSPQKGLPGNILVCFKRFLSSSYQNVTILVTKTKVDAVTYIKIEYLSNQKCILPRSVVNIKSENVIWLQSFEFCHRIWIHC